MFGKGKTYFSGSPVIIDISGLEWSGSSPFNIVKIKVLDGSDNIIGDFHADTGGQTAISFNIESALRALWADYDFVNEVSAANNAVVATSVAAQSTLRAYRPYSIKLFTEYINSTDNEFTTTESDAVTGGQCMIGRLTEWERYNIATKENADASHWEGSNLRNGDASTKPTSSPERVGRSSITSWVDVSGSGTTSAFFPAAAPTTSDTSAQHAPIVLRDNMDYQDFLFVNRRGAVETCSAMVKESMDITIETTSYNRVERPTFSPSLSLMALTSGDRRSWDMSSGYVNRDWAQWWTSEFLTSERHWMRMGDKYIPVIITPAKKSVNIYDKTKQQMAHVDFTVTLGLEG